MYAHCLSSSLLLHISLFALISLASCRTCLVSECVCLCMYVCVCGGGGCLLLLPELVNLLDCRSQSGERQREGERDRAGGGEWKRQRDEEWVFKDEDPVDISWNWREVVRRKTQGFALFHKQLRWRGHGDLKTTWNIYFLYFLYKWLAWFIYSQLSNEKYDNISSKCNNFLCFWNNVYFADITEVMWGRK